MYTLHWIAYIQCPQATCLDEYNIKRTNFKEQDNIIFIFYSVWVDENISQTMRNAFNEWLAVDDKLHEEFLFYVEGIYMTSCSFVHF